MDTADLAPRSLSGAPSSQPPSPSFISPPAPSWADTQKKRKGGRKKGSPKAPGSGRKIGSKNLISRDIREVAALLVSSLTYRMRLKAVIDAGGNTQMQILLHHYAFGAPPKFVEDPEGKKPALIFLSQYPLGSKDPFADQMRAIGASSTADAGVVVPLAPDQPVPHDPTAPDALVEVNP